MSTTIPGQQKGLAPEIRRLSVKYPELTQGDIARRVGCTTSNVCQVLNAFLNDSSESELREYQENQADIFDSVAYKLLRSVTQEKIDKTKPMEAITGAAILTDKARLVRGQATNYNVNILLDAAQAIRDKRNASE